MLLHCWWECKLLQPVRKMVWRFFIKQGIKPPYDPAIPLLGTYPEETKIERVTSIPLFTAALFKIPRTWNGKGNGNPFQYFFLESPRDRGAWWAAVHRVAQSQT